MAFHREVVPQLKDIIIVHEMGSRKQNPCFKRLLTGVLIHEG